MYLILSLAYELPECLIKCRGKGFYAKDDINILRCAEFEPRFLQIQITGCASDYDIGFRKGCEAISEY